MLLAQLAAPAVVVAWSPVKIIPPLAMVFAATRPRATSLAFLAGSIVALVAATVVFIGTPHLLDGFGWTAHGDAAWLRVGLGLGFLALAVVVWTRRGRTQQTPGWLAALARITPAAAALLAVLLTVLNPKVMVANAAAGLLIATAALGTAGTVVAVGVYTVLAGSTIIVPVLGYVLAADRVAEVIDSWRHKLARHQAVAATVLLAVIGGGMVATGALGLL